MANAIMGNAGDSQMPLPLAPDFRSGGARQEKHRRQKKSGMGFKFKSRDFGSQPRAKRSIMRFYLCLVDMKTTKLTQIACVSGWRRRFQIFLLCFFDETLPWTETWVAVWRVAVA